MDGQYPKPVLLGVIGLLVVSISGGLFSGDRVRGEAGELDLPDNIATDGE